MGKPKHFCERPQSPYLTWNPVVTTTTTTSTIGPTDYIILPSNNTCTASSTTEPPKFTKYPSDIRLTLNTSNTCELFEIIPSSKNTKGLILDYKHCEEENNIKRLLTDVSEFCISTSIDATIISGSGNFYSYDACDCDTVRPPATTTSTTTTNTTTTTTTLGPCSVWDGVGTFDLRSGCPNDDPAAQFEQLDCCTFRATKALGGGDRATMTIFCDDRQEGDARWTATVSSTCGNISLGETKLIQGTTDNPGLWQIIFVLDEGCYCFGDDPPEPTPEPPIAPCGNCEWSWTGLAWLGETFCSAVENGELPEGACACDPPPVTGSELEGDAAITVCTQVSDSAQEGNLP